VKRALVAAACAVALAGCYRTSIQLEQPGAPARPAGQHFHLGLLGVIELSSPIFVAGECGGSRPVVIKERIGILGSIVNAFLYYWIPIFHVHNTTVWCAAGGGAPPPPPP
jgi:hypothetical protein